MVNNDYMKMRFIDKLKNNCTVIGPFSKTSDPSMIESMGYAGFDFIIIDLEHGPNTTLNAQNLIRAADVTGTFPIVRVAKNAAVDIGKALDIGAKGVQVPQITSADEARAAVRYAKFGPEGERGVCRFVRAAEFSNKDRYTYFKEANERYLILQLEGVEAVNNIEEIVAVEGIDIIFLGPYDLSQALGVGGQIDHPIVIEKLTGIISICKERQIKTGVFTDRIDSAKEWVRLGVDYISFSVDVGILQDACKHIIQEVI